MVKQYDINKLSEEIKSIKAQIDILKNTVSALSDMRMEEKVIKGTIDCLQKRYLLPQS